MSYIIAGLGNPGEDYTQTRHNTGRIVLDIIRKQFEGADFVFDKKSNSLVSEISIGKGKKAEKVKLIALETFMNHSGKAVGQFVKTKKAAEKLVVIYDDFNLPLGRIKISWNRSSGGHNGLESVIKAVKTQEFVRFRIGVSPANSKGVAKVPHGEQAIEKFILGKYRDEEEKEIKKVAKVAAQALETFVLEGKEKAMSLFNQ
jgi:PTH1 family peptidyl-tRNA hydrolase